MSSKSINHPNLTTSKPRKVAVIGAGIAGLSAAYALHRTVRVTLMEAGSYFGGHANTVDVHIDEKTFGVDTGFLVYNERTYPGLIDLFETLKVPVAPSDMGFSVQIKEGVAHREWAGNSLTSVFAQKRQWFSPRHWGMLFDIVRFNRVATAVVTKGGEEFQTVGEFLDEHSFGLGFIDDYFLPMIACIWSCPMAQMRAYPIAALLQFCHNHGLLQITGRPQWFTVVGGSKNYVNRILACIDDKRHSTKVVRIVRHDEGVDVWTATSAKPERFDAVILACHPDQSLQMLGDAATELEQSILGAIRYQANDAVLHTDTAVMPHNPSAWAAWNYERRAGAGQAPEQAQTKTLASSDELVCLHYWLNKLQPLAVTTPIFVSLNPIRELDERKVIQRISYEHPIFDVAALQAQVDLAQLQGQQRTWFAGAWCRYGFHEDGFQAGLAAAQGILKND